MDLSRRRLTELPPDFITKETVPLVDPSSPLTVPQAAQRVILKENQLRELPDQFQAFSTHE